MCRVVIRSSFPPRQTPIRTTPGSCEFELASFGGPGCPKDPPDVCDGSEIYYRFVTYPHMAATVDADHSEAHTWCETTIQYNELLDYESKRPAADYNLRLHKNGTGVVDTISQDGPFNGLPYGTQYVSPVVEGPRPFWLPKCGSQAFKFRTDLYLTANKKGAKGTAQGETETPPLNNYGAQSGFSFDFQKCRK
ncbi:hypothetical protein K458DRAFT_481160 [Lentithecium fluviatile CBS 122367]|uniref:Uncharacterized protein n=1 Tax=Lentithecium fluviatile CBS 122367 TaxID=1168545 RepID=A0A6G1IHY6_9PLEO|nr:hypothetical protein K458DRAFT_481160 [Lentithecium fluviatile CBS 122367]